MCTVACWLHGDALPRLEHNFLSHHIRSFHSTVIENKAVEAQYVKDKLKSKASLSPFNKKTAIYYIFFKRISTKNRDKNLDIL